MKERKGKERKWRREGGWKKGRKTNREKNAEK